MNLYAISLFMKGGTQPVRLMFRHHEAQSAAWSALASSVAGGIKTFVRDDFANEIAVFGDHIAYAVRADMDHEAEMNIEIGLSNARAQVRANKRAEQDSELKGAAAVQQFRQQIMNGTTQFPRT